MTGGVLPSFSISKSVLEGAVIVDVLAEHVSICASKSEAKKAIQNQAININKSKIVQPDHQISNADFIHDRWLLLENGKKNKYLIEVH